MTIAKSIPAILAAAALAVGSIAPATAASPDPEATKSEKQEASKDKAAKPKRYCVKSTITGSNIPHTVCKTRDQWMSEDGFDPLGKR